MLTIFTTPKPFWRHFKTIQINAIRSWLSLRPACEVILFGNEDGVAEISAELGIKHIPEVECNEYGTPLTNYMFDDAQKIAGTQHVGFVSADIILMGDFLTALQSIPQRRFLMVGRRWDVELNELVDYNDSEWEARLRKHLARHGKLHPPAAIDYFIFNRGLYRDIPPFAIGRAAIDNWLIFQARFLKAQVYDATAAVTAVHQNHDISFKIGTAVNGNRENYPHGVYDGPERTRNIKLMGGVDRGFTIEHATRILTPQGMKRALTPRHLYFRLAAMPVLIPYLHFLRRPMKALTRLIVYIRSVLRITQD